MNERLLRRVLYGIICRDLTGEDIVAIFLDGKAFADATMVIALGITMSGEKRFLGFVETDTDQVSSSSASFPGASPIPS